MRIHPQSAVHPQYRAHLFGISICHPVIALLLRAMFLANSAYFAIPQSTIEFVDWSMRKFENQPMQKLSITWLGHSTFIVRTPGGKRVLFDPWLSSNPSCPDSMKKPPKVDLILASHGHFDHIEDLVACARESGAPVVGIFELCDWLTRKGIVKTAPMNKGGSQQIAGLRVTMTDARHSSGYFDNGQMVYMGEPAGFV